jgi:hypothetical protein
MDFLGYTQSHYQNWRTMENNVWMQAIQTMVDSTIQENENCFVLPGTFKNSAAVGSVSVLDYWPLQAEWPSQQDEIAL